MFFYPEFGDLEMLPVALHVISASHFHECNFACQINTERQNPHAYAVTSNCIPNNIMFSHEAGGSRGWSLATWVLLLHSFEACFFNWAGKVDFHNEVLCSQTREAYLFCYCDA
jgi:hypothetical protein